VRRAPAAFPQHPNLVDGVDPTEPLSRKFPQLTISINSVDYCASKEVHMRSLSRNLTPVLLLLASAGMVLAVTVSAWPIAGTAPPPAAAKSARLTSEARVRVERAFRTVSIQDAAQTVRRY
jgi:hypothetical protein